MNVRNFKHPSGVSAMDGSGDVYVADTYNHRIRRITSGGAVSTFAGSEERGCKDGFENGVGTEARFRYPYDVSIDVAGNLFVADYDNHMIRKITSEGAVSTLAGSGKEGFKDGIGTEAQFSWPRGVSLDVAGNVYVADTENHRIRKITPEGEVIIFAGSGKRGFKDGIGTEAEFADPYGLFVDDSGNVYVADTDNHTIRKITSEGEVSTFAGSGELGFKNGIGIKAKFHWPTSVVVDKLGNVYVADTGNHMIRKITSEGAVSTFAGSEERGFKDGFGTEARFKNPYGLSLDAAGNLYVADYGNHQIRKITSEGTVSTLAA